MDDGPGSIVRDGVRVSFRSLDIDRQENVYLAARAGNTGLPSLSLALSGGGLRACSQGIGALQLLKEKGALHRLDVVSCVSGGGYCGTGWMSHLHAQRDKQPAPCDAAEREKVAPQKYTCSPNQAAEESNLTHSLTQHTPRC